jgi:hypothetical protein
VRCKLWIANLLKKISIQKLSDHYYKYSFIAPCRYCLVASAIPNITSVRRIFTLVAFQAPLEKICILLGKPLLQASIYQSYPG